ncbi:MAG: hypothetical protein GX166_04520 [Clostridiaceae bacterium]|nr:hypothetical protein [Clostridiaceae bacterium]
MPMARKYKTEIYNDRKNLDWSNYEIVWDNHVATLTLKGEEQVNEIITITFMNDDVMYRAVQPSHNLS